MQSECREGNGRVHNVSIEMKCGEGNGRFHSARVERGMVECAVQMWRGEVYSVGSRKGPCSPCVFTL